MKIRKSLDKNKEVETRGYTIQSKEVEITGHTKQSGNCFQNGGNVFERDLCEVFFASDIV